MAQHGKCNIFFKSLHPTIHAAGGGKGAGLLTLHADGVGGGKGAGLLTLHAAGGGKGAGLLTLHAAVLDAGGAGVGPCDLAASPRLNVRGRAGPDDR